MHVTQTRQAGASTTVLDAKAKSPRGTERSFDLLNERDSNIFYLKEELELDDSTMMNIIRKHSWLLYLDVETNLIPTIEALNDSGFTLDDIKMLIAKVPSILAIDSEWTMPEKLLSLQQMFYLNTSQLCSVLTEQPMLLTSSIDRNYEVASFLSQKVGISPKDITKLMTSSKLGPAMAMTSYAVLSLSWSLLIEEYEFTSEQARKLIKLYPNILSHRFLDHHADRVKFFEIMGIPIGSDMSKTLILRNPRVLIIDASFFLFSNYKILYESLALSSDKVMKMVCIYPQLLTLHPITLERSCNFNLFLLTGMDRFRSMTADDNDNDDDWGDSWDDDFIDDNTYGGNNDDKVDEHDNTESSASSLNMLEANEDEEEEVPQWAYMTKKQKRDERRANLILSMSSFLDSDVLTPQNQEQELKELDLINDIVKSFQLQQIRSNKQNAQRLHEKNVVIKELDRQAVQKNAQRILGKNYHDTISRKVEASGTSRRTAPLLFRKNSSKMSQQLSCAYFRQISFPLGLPEERGAKIISNVPWLLSYRPERSKKILAVLAVTLALTPKEMLKCVSLYPRVFSLAVDGKITAVLRTLAHAAAEHLLRPGILDSGLYIKDDTTSNSADLDLGKYNTSKIERYAIIQARKETIRRMVREVVVKFPLILGTSMKRIETKLDEWKTEGAEWNEFVSILRTTEEIELKRSISRALTVERKEKQRHREEKKLTKTKK